MASFPFPWWPWSRRRRRPSYGDAFLGRAAFGGSGSMAGGDSFGCCCGLVQGLCGLVEAFLLPRSRGFPAENLRDLRWSSSQVSRTAGSPRDVGISSRSGHPPALTVGAPRAHPAAGAGRGATNAHTAQISHPPALTVSAPRVQSGTSNSHTAPFSRPQALAVSAPRASSATRVPSGASISRPPAPTVSAPRASPATRVQSGISNSHTAPISRPPAPTVSAPRASYAARVQSGTSNCHTAPISRPPALTVSAPRATSATRIQSGTSNSHTARISHPPALTVSAPRASPAARVQSGSKWNSQPQQSDDDDDDDDDCVILDIDPHSAVAMTDAREGSASARDGGSDEELQIVAEKGKVACRDFPHSRHLCSNMPFGTTSHEKHCTMCYCFVCDAPAPCSYWGKALSVDDHCHATDKETKWRILRGAFRQQSKRSGTSNGHSAQVSHPIALTASAPRASSASNGHSAQVTPLVDPTVSSPRARPAAGAGRGTSNGHSALITQPVEPTVSAARPHCVARTGRGTSNTHTSQITQPVEPSMSGTSAYPAGSTGRGISNAHTAQITRPMEQTISAPRVYPAARAGRDLSNAHSVQITYPATANGEPDAPEGATVYVGNLPYRIDNERLKLSFQHAGVVLFSKVIYNRETGQSCGYGFVTMSTVQEAETAVRMYHGSVMHGRPLTVNITAPRGGARVDTTRRQSGSPLRIFVCNLPAQVDNSQLKELFSKHGKVVDARVIYESREGDCCSKGFGFVAMATEEESHNAIRALNKQVLEGHALGVKVARERPERGSPSLSNQTPLQNAVSENQNTHTSVRASLNVEPTLSVPRARSGTSNAYTAQVTHRLDPTASAPRPAEHRILSLEG